MSKKYKGKTCVYCGVAQSEGPDHVIAREFFPQGHRPDIPKVPACKSCNGRKSALENYFTVLLPFGSNHPSAQTILVDDVSRRLDRNRKLARELKFLAGYSWGENEAGVVVPSLTLPVDESLMDELITFITQGLILHHFGVMILGAHFIQAAALTEHGETQLKSQHFSTIDGKVWDDLGPGIFQYVGKQGADYPELTMWLMRFYGGVAFAGKADRSKSMCFVAASGRREVLDRVKSKVKFGIPT